MVSWDSFKIQRNKFVSSTVRQKNEFVRSFFRRIRGYQKSFRNYLTFTFETQCFSKFVRQCFTIFFLYTQWLWFWLKRKLKTLSKVKQTEALKRSYKLQISQVSVLRHPDPHSVISPTSIYWVRQATTRIVLMKCKL